MKEKTFEELAFDESFKMSFGSEKIHMVKVSDVVTLMQQVREATISECIDKISELHDSIYKGAYEEYLATNLPTDRIKTNL